MMVISPINGLVLRSVIARGMNAPRFNEFLMQTKQRLNLDERMVFIYDGALAHRGADNPGENTELKNATALQPFLEHCWTGHKFP